MKMAMKNMKTLGIAEMPPSPPPPPPLGIKDKRALRMAEKPHPTLAMKDNKNLGIAEKPLPPPPLGFLRQVQIKKRFFRSAANGLRIRVRLFWSLLDGGRSWSESERGRTGSPDMVEKGSIEITSIWPDIDGSFDGYRWISTRSRRIYIEKKVESDGLEFWWSRCQTGFFFFFFFSLSERFFYLSGTSVSFYTGPEKCRDWVPFVQSTCGVRFN